MNSNVLFLFKMSIDINLSIDLIDSEDEFSSDLMDFEDDFTPLFY